jgi:hypothetical protein
VPLPFYSGAHPVLCSFDQGLEFLSNHAEFQEKYAVTVITRIFYSVNKCHSGRITSRQVLRSDLLEAFSLVDEEEDINKVTRYFSYEHFYVLYCRFWELDHDRDYRITREDLLKYGDHSLSHMIVDRIFDAAPRPFEQEKVNREFLSYEDFIYFMLSGKKRKKGSLCASLLVVENALIFVFLIKKIAICYRGRQSERCFGPLLVQLCGCRWRWQTQQYGNEILLCRSTTSNAMHGT